MRRYLVATFPAACVTMLILFGGATRAAQNPGPLRARAALLRVNQERFVIVVELTNQARRPRSEIQVDVLVGDAHVGNEIVPSIPPKNSRVVTIPANALAGDPFVVIKTRNMERMIPLHLPLDDRGAPSAVNYVIPALVGAASAVGGGWLTNFYLRRREHERMLFEWSQLHFEKYEHAYRTFLARWAGGTNPRLYQDALDALRREVLIPLWLQEQARELQATLDSDIDEPEKVHAVDRFRAELHGHLAHPWTQGRRP